MTLLMGIINATPDSFWAPSRGNFAIMEENPDIIDVGAVSTRPGAPDVSEEEEWSRLEPVLKRLMPLQIPLSVDTFRSGIVRKVYEMAGPFIVNDISAGEDDQQMMPTVGGLGLKYIAMHKRGNPRTMDSQASYGAGGVVEELRRYFTAFSEKAERYGIEDWILDPGLGFAKDREQNFEILGRLEELKCFGRQILIGAADKRFTGGDTEAAHLLALRHGADILRVHDVAAARRTVELFLRDS